MSRAYEILTPNEVRAAEKLMPEWDGNAEEKSPMDRCIGKFNNTKRGFRGFPVCVPPEHTTVTCSRCGDTISAASNYCTSIADCVNLPIRSKWIIPGDGK